MASGGQQEGTVLLFPHAEQVLSAVRHMEREVSGTPESLNTSYMVMIYKEIFSIFTSAYCVNGVCLWLAFLRHCEDF